MSRVYDYYYWLLKRARDNWKETDMAYMAYYNQVQALGNYTEREACEPKIAQMKAFSDAAYNTYMTISMDDPGNYSAHKRTTHSRRARRRWLS